MATKRQTSTIFSPNGQTTHNFTTINPLQFQAEDGGILDAWEQFCGDEWLFAAGFEDWYRWVGTHWQESSGYGITAQIQQLLDMLNKTARKMLKSAADDDAKKLLGRYIAATKRTKARVSSVEGMARNLRWIPADLLDSSALLNLRNGTFELKTKVLRDHDPEDLLTYCLPYKYDPAAIAPNWKKVLSRLDDEIVDFIQEFAGYALTTETKHELALWLKGYPGGGKSTIIGGFETMLGPKAGLLGLSDIEQNRFALSSLPGKTLVVATEQPSNYVASMKTLNAIISGEPVRVDRKYRDAIEITPRAKVMWAMNDFPRVGDANDGIFRRVKVIEFPSIPEDERDPMLKEAIAEEGGGILNWALEGLERLQVRGRFDVPDAVKTTTQDFIDQNDIPAVFVKECCQEGLMLEVQSSELYEVYQAWARKTGHRPQSATSIANDWRRLGYTKTRKTAGVFWEGLDLTSAARNKYTMP